MGIPAKVPAKRYRRAPHEQCSQAASVLYMVIAETLWQELLEGGPTTCTPGCCSSLT